MSQDLLFLHHDEPPPATIEVMASPAEERLATREHTGEPDVADWTHPRRICNADGACTVWLGIPSLEDGAPLALRNRTVFYQFTFHGIEVRLVAD